MAEETTAVSLVNGSKEIGEIFEAVEALILDFKAKKPITEIALGNLKKLQVAVEGYDKIPAEIKDKERSFPTAGYHAGKLLAAF